MMLNAEAKYFFVLGLIPGNIRREAASRYCGTNILRMYKLLNEKY